MIFNRKIERTSGADYFVHYGGVMLEGPEKGSCVLIPIDIIEAAFNLCLKKCLVHRPVNGEK